MFKIFRAYQNYTCFEAVWTSSVTFDQTNNNIIIYGYTLELGRNIM